MATPIIFLFAYTIFSPFISPYLISKGFTKETIALAFSVAPFFLIFMSSITGRLSDIVGRRRVLVSSVFLLMLSLLIYLLMDRSIVLLVLASIISVVSYQIYNSAALTRAEDRFTDQFRGRETGLFETLLTVGGFVGSLTGTLIVSFLPISSTLKFSLTIFFLIFALGFIYKNDRPGKISKSDFNFLHQLRTFIKTDKLKGMAIIGFTTNFTSGATVVFIPLLLTQELKARIFYVGLFSAILSLAHLSQYYFGRYYDKHNAIKMILWSAALYGFAMLFFFVAHFTFVVLIGALAIGLAGSAWNVSAYSFMSEIGEKTNHEGSVIGSYASFAYIGVAFGYIVGGLVSAQIGPRFIFLLYALLIVLSVLIARKYVNT